MSPGWDVSLVGPSLPTVLESVEEHDEGVCRRVLVTCPTLPAVCVIELPLLLSPVLLSHVLLSPVTALCHHHPAGLVLLRLHPVLECVILDEIFYQLLIGLPSQTALRLLRAEYLTVVERVVGDGEKKQLMNELLNFAFKKFVDEMSSMYFKKTIWKMKVKNE